MNDDPNPDESSKPPGAGKPCPFCAGEPIPEPLEYDPDGIVGVRAFYVQCSDCIAFGPWCDTPEEAKQAWNRRVPT